MDLKEISLQLQKLASVTAASMMLVKFFISLYSFQVVLYVLTAKNM